MKNALLWTIRIYQRWLSPLLLPACRYVPSCSEYAAEAVEFHGAFKGGLLAAGRLLRCHPVARGGFDPVPTQVAHAPSRLACAALHAQPTRTMRATHTHPAGMP